MANADKPFGLRAITNPYGGVPRVREYDVSSTYATTIGEGAIVGFSFANGIRIMTSTLLGTGSNVIGVAVHPLKATPGAGAVLKVFDDPNQEFEVQLDDATVTTEAAMLRLIGKNGGTLVGSNIVINHTTLQAKTELDASSLMTTVCGATGTQVLQVVDIARSIDNELAATAGHQRVVVRFRTHKHIFGTGIPLIT